MKPSKRGLAVARILFLAVGAWFIWRGLHDRGDDLRAGITATPLWGLLLSLVLVCAGLVCTGLLWRRVLAAFGYELAVVPALAIFFFGQLGKYIPGSVWSFGAQASGARRHDVPVLTTVNASLVFLGIHVASGAVLGFGASTFLGAHSRPPLWLCIAATAGGLVALLPSVINRLTRMVARSGDRLCLDLRVESRLLFLMACAWTFYAASLAALRPHVDVSTLLVIIAAFAVAYVAGVLVFLAPAGLGAREATFVLIAGHTLGVGTAAAVALLTRVVMTVADVALAVGATALDTWSARSSRHGAP